MAPFPEVKPIAHATSVPKLAKENLSPNERLGNQPTIKPFRQSKRNSDFWFLRTFLLWIKRSFPIISKICNIGNRRGKTEDNSSNDSVSDGVSEENSHFFVFQRLHQEFERPVAAHYLCLLLITPRIYFIQAIIVHDQGKIIMKRLKTISINPFGPTCDQTEDTASCCLLLQSSKEKENPSLLRSSYNDGDAEDECISVIASSILKTSSFTKSDIASTSDESSYDIQEVNDVIDSHPSLGVKYEFHRSASRSFDENVSDIVSKAGEDQAELRYQYEVPTFKKTFQKANSWSNMITFKAMNESAVFENDENMSVSSSGYPQEFPRLENLDEFQKSPLNREDLQRIENLDLQDQKLRKDQFDLQKVIGVGAAYVFFAKFKHQNQEYPVAVKKVKKKDILRNEKLSHLNAEKKVLESVRHPFIVRLFGTFQDKYYLYFVMEYVQGGELFRFLRHVRCLENKLAKFYASEVFLAIQYLHSMKIVYRDIKPENLLLDALGHMKVIDLGYAAFISDRTSTMCGTPDYMAPEIIMQKEYSYEVDWWAFGILIYEMLHGNAPFSSSEPLEIYANILQNEVEFNSHVHRNAKDLISRLLQKQPKHRLGSAPLGAAAIQKHRWFKHVNWEDLFEKKIVSPYVPPLNSLFDTEMFDKYNEPEDMDVSITEQEQSFFRSF